MSQLTKSRLSPGVALAILPAIFLLAAFLIPNAYLLFASMLRDDGQAGSVITTENFEILFRRTIYVRTVLRTFFIGASVATLVVVLAFPTAYLLSRMQSRWRGLLMVLALAPLLASVVVRTYGWWVILNREGTLNSVLQLVGAISQPIDFMPSSLAIIIGLSHGLLPFGILTLMTVLNRVSPQLERAAMSLGASRLQTFRAVVFPLAAPGTAGAFLITFSLAIGAYATPAILGGPSHETMGTMIYNLMMVTLDWSVGSALAVVLVASVMLLMGLAMVIGRGQKAGSR